ncbi:MAG: hypothetical protein DRI84_00270 [Bacteroidetes bacterium]|nr:MAG: hypothetical protein DRI84_00270 [Bacteroidota bacterium]
MKIKLTIFLSILLIAQATYSQSKIQLKADEYFNMYDYSNAILKYQKVKEKSTDVYRHLAESYLATRQYDKAEKYFKKVVNAEDSNFKDYYQYAYSLRLNEKYEEATKWMIKFHNEDTEDSRGKLFMEDTLYYVELQKPNTNVFIANLKMNTSNSDFGTAFFEDKIIFASDRDNSFVVSRQWNWDSKPFLQLYKAEMTDNGQLDSIKEFSNKTESKYHDGPASFTKDGSFMVFTRNNLDENSSSGAINLVLMYAERRGKGWSSPVVFPFNDKEYSTGHGSLSADGKVLYFVSDRPDGYGGTDIYKTYRLSDGSWSKPINMGSKVNTEGNEMFPFIHENNEFLFFSSNGLMGLGGQDLFVANVKKRRVTDVVNLGVPVNSSRDDFAIILDDTQKKGYFTSDRQDGEGNDDIYSYKLSKPFKFGIKLKGKSYDQFGEILAETNVELYSEDGAKVGGVITDTSGKYEFVVDRGVVYTLIGTKEKCFDGVKDVNTDTTAKLIEVDMVLVRSDVVMSVNCLVTETGSDKEVPGVHMVFKDIKTGQIIDTVTSRNGTVGWPLEGYYLNDKLTYEITLDRKGYFAKTVVFSTRLEKVGVYNIHEVLDISMTKIPVGADLSNFVDVKPIYFDLGKAVIRADAARELDKIAKVMNDNSTMVIELGAHTDSRGSDASNLKLSDKRAKASAEYIGESISNPNRIYGRGYGETKFKVVDAEIHKQYDYLPEGQVLDVAFISSLPTKKMRETAHQINRRTEFIILRM